MIGPGVTSNEQKKPFSSADPTRQRPAPPVPRPRQEGPSQERSSPPRRIKGGSQKLGVRPLARRGTRSHADRTHTPEVLRRHRCALARAAIERGRVETGGGPRQRRGRRRSRSRPGRRGSEDPEVLRASFGTGAVRPPRAMLGRTGGRSKAAGPPPRLPGGVRRGCDAVVRGGRGNSLARSARPSLRARTEAPLRPSRCWPRGTNRR